MRLIIFFCTISFFIISCKQNNSKQKELEIRERELIMKEKEFSLKYSDSTQSENTITNTSIQTTNLETEQKIDLPFIGKKYFETRPVFLVLVHQCGILKSYKMEMYFLSLYK
jgi:hypothetical protein